LVPTSVSLRSVPLIAMLSIPYVALLFRTAGLTLFRDHRLRMATT
jgi:hypothetical protein